MTRDICNNENLITRSLTTAGCMALCAFSIWLALLSFQYSRALIPYEPTPSHGLHRGGEDCMVVFDGDSLTAGYGLSSEAETYPFKTMALLPRNCTWENVGISGSFVEWWLGSSAALLRSRPLGTSIYVVWIGSNDLMYNPEPLDDLWQKIERLALEGSTNGWKIVLATITPRVQALRPDLEIPLMVGDLFGPRSFESRRAVFNDMLRKGAVQHGFSIVDFGGDSQIGIPGSVNSKYYLPDRTHFSSLGTDLLAQLAARALAAMMASRK